MSNAQISRLLTPVFDEYIEHSLHPRGFTSFTSMICNVEDSDDDISSLQLCDEDSDIGTYMFYRKESKIIVADYMDSTVIYGEYTDHQKFDDDYDIPLTLSNIEYFLNILESNKAYCYIGINSLMITHHELMTRKGWNDRRIKKEFGIVPRCEYDGVSYYPLDKVLEKEHVMK